jgi:hypothetical protein
MARGLRAVTRAPVGPRIAGRAIGRLLIVKMDIQVGAATTFIPSVCGTD